MATFDAELSRRIDVYLDAIDKVQAWPDSCAKCVCLAILDKHLRRLLKRVAA